MAIDHFDRRQTEAFRGFRGDVFLRVVEGLSRLADLLHVEVEGVAHVPDGRALFVANHTFGFDIGFPLCAIWRETGRHVWVLGEHAWWHFPWLRRLAADIGVVDGTQGNAERLLEKGELVLVLPGGLRESMKPRSLRYRLLWKDHLGFARLAIRTGSPIVPIAAIGGDDLFEWVDDAFARGERWHVPIPIPKPKWGVPLPHRTHLRYVIGEPILPHPRREAADDPQVVMRLQHEVRGALDELVTEELARREHVRTTSHHEPDDAKT